MDISALEKKATDLYIKYNSARDSYNNTIDSLQSLSEEYNKLVENKALLERSKPFIDDIIEKFSESSLKKLEDLLSLGLSRIF
jgi:DNA-directed RNA polymerase specialized sigma subunit